MNNEHTPVIVPMCIPNSSHIHHTLHHIPVNLFPYNANIRTDYICNSSWIVRYPQPVSVDIC